MKIGVLTFHDGMNHGGFLQAYALAHRLSEWGLDVQIIHYRNRTHLLQEYRGLLLRYNPLNSARNLAKIWTFKRAQRRMPLTPFTTSVKAVADMGFDAIVVGSDIVWNFQWPFLGGDRIYFGRGLEASRLVAYAPSFGAAVNVSALPDDIVESLQEFHALSVRDKRSLALLQKALPARKVELVLDPTFLVDWKSEIVPCPIPDRFLLVYAYQLRPCQIDQARQYAHRAGLRTLAVGYPQSWCDHQKTSLGPFEFLHCFRQASAVLTSTFHGTILAIQFSKPFFTKCNESIEDKTRGLLTDLNLEGRLSDDACLVAACLSDAPDFDLVHATLAHQKSHSEKYLNHALQVF